MLIPIVESLWLQSGPYVRAAAQIHDELRDMSGTHHHWALIEALERGDKAQAVEGAEERHHALLQPGAPPARADTRDSEEARAYG